MQSLDIPSTHRRRTGGLKSLEPLGSGLANPVLQLLYLATIFTMPFFRWRQIGFLKVDWALVLALACLAGPCLVASKRLPKSFQANFWPLFGLFFTINLLSSILSPYPDQAFSGIIVLVLDFLFISINLIMITRGGYRYGIYFTIIAAVSINAVLAMMGYFLHVKYFELEGRGIGGTINANNAALMGVFVVPLCFEWMMRAKSMPVKALALAAMVINILGVVSSESRTGFMVMILVLGMLVLHARPVIHPRYLGLVLAGGAIVVLLAVALTPKSYLQRISTISEGASADASTARRSTYVIVGLRSFVHHPILGTGADTFKAIWVHSRESRLFKHTERACHNTYLEVIVATGVVGLVVFLLLLGQVLRNFNEAIRLFREKNLPGMISVTNGYRFAFIGLLFYFLFKSGLDHKMFLLILPLSQVALDLARDEPAAVPAESPVDHAPPALPVEDDDI